MRFLALWHLKRLCDKHGLDYQEIDETLTYTEAKQYLMSLIQKNIEDLLIDAEAQYKQYLKEHFLTSYVCHVRNGETETGEPVKATAALFSLEALIKH